MSIESRESAKGRKSDSTVHHSDGLKSWTTHLDQQNWLHVTKPTNFDEESIDTRKGNMTDHAPRDTCNVHSAEIEPSSGTATGC